MDARAPTVVESNDGQAHGRRQVHDLLDLLAVRLAQRATEDGEVLGVDADLAPVDLAVARDDAIGVGTRVLEAHARGDVAIQHVKFLEGVFVKEVLKALASGHSTLRAMTLNRYFSTSNTGLSLAGFELVQTLGH